jgi:hypothetical protein
MKIEKTNYPLFNIVGNGAILHDEIGEGRFIPVLIIDFGGFSDASDLFIVHRSTVAGDVKTTWSKDFTLFKSKYIFLQIEFLRPMEISFGIRFDLSNQFPLVDSVINANCFYLCSGKLGDQVSEQKSDRILIEVPETGFKSLWQTILTDTLTSQYKKIGANKKDIRSIVDLHIKEIRKIQNIIKK